MYCVRASIKPAIVPRIHGRAHAGNAGTPSSDKPGLDYSFEVAKKARFGLATVDGLVVQTTQEV